MPAAGPAPAASPSGAPRRVGVVVAGRVQGVGFRWSAARVAEDLGLTGWVRNRADGAVAAEVQGPADAVAAFLQWVGEGPPGARVTGVDVRDLPPTEDDRGFEVRHP